MIRKPTTAEKRRRERLVCEKRSYKWELLKHCLHTRKCRQCGWQLRHVRSVIASRFSIRNF